MKKISIAKDFSIYPGGRTEQDGPFSGKEFREKFLMPIFKTDEAVEIDFDGTRGYGSSFLEEAFGGLIRKGIKKERIQKQINLKSSKTSIILEVERYIKNAKR